MDSCVRRVAISQIGLSQQPNPRRYFLLQDGCQLWIFAIVHKNNLLCGNTSLENRVKGCQDPGVVSVMNHHAPDIP